MSVFETESIVLKQFELGEADKIITFYTKDRGKIRAVARGVRKSNSRISGLVLPFSYNLVTFYRGRSLDRINEIKSIFTFSSLREDLTIMAYCTFLTELVEKVGLEDNPNQKLFSLLLASFHYFINADREKYDYIELVFKVHLLVLLGLKPGISSCVCCGNDYKLRNINLFSISQGGIICAECFSQNERVEKISGEALKVLEMIYKSGLKPFDKLKVSNKAFKELDDLINSFLLFYLDIELKSLAFLNTIKNLG